MAAAVLRLASALAVTAAAVQEGETAAMSSLRVTPAQLETLGASAHRSCGEVRAEHTRLTAQLSPLFGADWSGAAAAQFTALYENFDRHARGLCDALDGIGALLARAGVTYAEVEQQIASSFR